jgi:hypothetical protein
MLGDINTNLKLSGETLNRVSSFSRLNVTLAGALPFLNL